MAWAQEMCKQPLACGSEHQGLATALVANLLHLTVSEQGLDTLTALGKDMEILFRSSCRTPPPLLHAPPLFITTLSVSARALLPAAHDASRCSRSRVR